MDPCFTLPKSWQRNPKQLVLSPILRCSISAFQFFYILFHIRGSGRLPSNAILPKLYSEIANLWNSNRPGCPFQSQQRQEALKCIDFISVAGFIGNLSSRINKSKYVAYSTLTETMLSAGRGVKHEKARSYCEMSEMMRPSRPIERSEQPSPALQTGPKSLDPSCKEPLKLASFTLHENFNAKRTITIGKKISPNYLNFLERRSKSLDKREKQLQKSGLKKMVSVSDFLRGLKVSISTRKSQNFPIFFDFKGKFYKSDQTGEEHGRVCRVPVSGEKLR